MLLLTAARESLCFVSCLQMLLGDEAYPCGVHFLSMYCTRINKPEEKKRRRTSFNRSLAGTHDVAEQAIGTTLTLRFLYLAWEAYN